MTQPQHKAPSRKRNTTIQKAAAESKKQPFRCLPGTKNPENLSDPRKYSHWKNPVILNEQLTTKQHAAIKAL